MFIKVQKPTPSTCKGLMFIQPSLKINKPTRIDLLITFQALKFRGIACSKELSQKVTTKYSRNTLIRKLSSPNGGVFLSLRKTSPVHSAGRTLVVDQDSKHFIQFFSAHSHPFSPSHILSARVSKIEIVQTFIHAYFFFRLYS